MSAKVKNVLVVVIVIILLMVAAILSGRSMRAEDKRIAELEQRLKTVEDINQKQTRALLILAGGLDDFNRQQQLRDLYEQMKQNGKGL